MSYSRFMKTLGIVVVYILLAAGAIVMLMPFAWMIITSLKTSGEINAWPPTWTTKNFSNEWDLKLVPDSSISGPRTGLSLSEFRTLSTQQSFNPDKIVYRIDGDFVRRGEIELLFEEINYSENYDVDPVLLDIYQYLENVQVRDDLANLFVPKDYSLENFENIYFALFSQENGYFKQTSTIRRIQQTLNKIQSFLDVTLERNINILPYFRINDNMSQQEIEHVLERKDFFSQYLLSIKENIEVLDFKLRTFTPELRIINQNEVQEIIDLLADFLSNIYTFDDNILSNTNTLIMRNIYTPIMDDINTLTFFLYFIEKYESLQDIKIQDVKIAFEVPNKDTMYKNIIDEITKSQFPEEFKQIVIREANKQNIENLNAEIVSLLENDIIDDIAQNLVQRPSELSIYINIIRTLSNKNTPLEDAQKALSQSDYNFLIQNISNKESELNRILEKRKEYDKILTDFDKFFLNTISKVNIVEAPSFIDYILYKNDSTIEIYTNNVPAIWLLDETPNANVGYSFGQVLANIFQNYVDAWNAAPFSKYYLNTIFVASATTILEIIFASMAAFAFSKLNFWGKDFIFITFLATMMIPGEVLLVPNYITISRFSWIDSYYALIVPWVISVFAIFLIRQQFMTVPNELWDAAKIDGSSSWRFLWTVMVPLSKPAVMTGALLKFVGSWNAFLWVLIVTKSPEMRTLSVGLQNFRTDAGEIYNLLMAASTFTMIPIVILFLFLQRYFIEGIARTGLKG
ncbi:carbohydrate ABC transporter permease [Petrotoga sp. 9PW.55.5.1]|uniref:carbohydrate ABC transporter permease n=1 Tax=Petrotoga sp. 9PW.55.5.1 TaxID=1308979 RepID=UPI0018F3B9B2|nr:carbohydrate ABC transporter permease [Petrotoga sp. 9PW.55.5.1]